MWKQLVCVRIPGGALSRLEGDMAFVHVFKVLAQEVGNKYIRMPYVP